MKTVLLSTCLAVSLILTACGNKKAAVTEPEATANQETSAIATTGAESREEPAETLLAVNLSVGGRGYPAKLYDNAAARALVDRMPMELDMRELHGNEKYYYLPEELPTDTENPGVIHTGDLMLYGSDCLVLFYEDFQSSFSYTRLGYLEDPKGLSEAAGSGSVTVTFEPAENAG
ncbi:cyclophilin-like fold protein [Clostridium transplantifaecale]|uniref:cyclophilin-like fold protein n=1 Tax=Clostridium transplantifaecale TaxID=2479838 RepID=UPI0013DE754B|nr:cyclophilin-like fold protein [Clostridium transplantifaecale]